MLSFKKEFEDYILQDKDRSNECFKSFTPGLEHDLFVKYYMALHNIGKDQEQSKIALIQIKDILQKLGPQADQILGKEGELIRVLKEFDLESTSETRQSEIIDQLKTTYSLNYSSGLFSSQMQMQGLFNWTAGPNPANKDGENKNKHDFSYLSIDTLTAEIYQQCVNNENFDLLLSLDLSTLGEFIDLKLLTSNFYYQLFLKTNSSNVTFPYHKLDESALNPLIEELYLRKDDVYVKQNLSFIFEKLTVSQLKYIHSKLNSNFDRTTLFTSLTQKLFSDRILKCKTTRDKCKLYKEMYESSKEYNVRFLTKNFLISILKFGLEINEISKEDFISFIKLSISGAPKQSKKEVVRDQNSNSENLIEDKPLIDNCLGLLFGKYECAMEEFTPFLQTELVQKIYCKERFLSKGIDSELVIQLYGQEWYESKVKESNLSFSKNNKDHFKEDEIVSLDVEMKNVSTLYVKVYEMNTETYYLANKESFNIDLCLDGLVANFEETYSLNENPVILKSRTFEVPQISKRKGVYIVEFLGGGKSCRAFIKIGGLSLITNPTSSGFALYIVNQEGVILKGDEGRRGVWFKETFHKLSKDGLIIIPYKESHSSGPAVIVDEHFAELEPNLVVPSESYSLQGRFHFSHESLIMGNTVKVIFKPQLQINGRLCMPSNLSSCTAKVLMVKVENDNNIPIATTIEKLEITSGKDIEFSFQVPPKLISLSFSFEAQIYKKSTKTYEKLNVDQNVSISGQLTDSQLINILLVDNGTEHLLKVVGKNGEVKPNVTLNISMFHLKSQLQQKVKPIELTTNNEGLIVLYNLKSIAKMLMVTTNYQNQRFSCTFEIGKDYSYYYPDTYDLIKGEELQIPIHRSSATDKYFLDYYVQLFKIVSSTSSIIESLTLNTDYITYSPFEENSNSGTLTIKNLSEGNYILWFNENIRLTPITLKVYENAKPWGETNFIIEDKQIVENLEPKFPVQIESVKLSRSEENGSLKLTAKVSNNTPSTRVHIFGTHFARNTCNSLSDNLNAESKRVVRTSVQKIKSWTNTYASNRTLSDEMQYVIDRKQQERFLGNSLEKPSLLLKRKLVRDTETENENLQVEQDYNDVWQNKECEMKDECYQMNYSRGAPISYAAQCYQQQQPSAYNSFQMQDTNLMASMISTFNNFLLISPLELLNLKLNTNGAIEVVDERLVKYKNFEIVVIDDLTSTSRNITNNFCQFITSSWPESKDLTIKECLDSSKFYCENRKSYLHSLGDKAIISDISSVSYKLVDSVDRLINFFGLINKAIFEDWVKVNFFTKLSQLKEEEFLDKLDKYFSHEFNVFLYFRHRELFDTYVLPVLKFKNVKTVIDYFLLNDTEALERIAENPLFLSKLNIVEKVLIIKALNEVKPILISHLIKQFEREASISSLEPQEVKRRFNILMNMKVEEEPIIGNTLGGVRCQAKAARICPRFVEDDMFGSNECAAVQECGYLNDEAYNDECEEECYREPVKMKKDFTKCQEFCETHYLYASGYSPNILPELSKPFNYLWSDIAKGFANGKRKLTSENIFYVPESASELIFILAFLDLPYTSLVHDSKMVNEKGIEFTLKSNATLFTKEIAETTSEINHNLMLVQIIREVGKPDSDETINEYIINKIYNQETVVTNISNSTIAFEMLIQIPEGSIPVYASDYIKTINDRLDKYSTKSYPTFFYFPKVGNFKQAPSNVGVDGKVVCVGEVLSYEVKAAMTAVITNNIDSILEAGNNNEILSYFKNCSQIKQDDLLKISKSGQDINFYSEMIKILRSKGVYDSSFWSYAFIHKDKEAIKEILQVNQNLITDIGGSFSSSLVTIDEKNSALINRHLDYDPIINSRVHRLADNSPIFNKEFKETYQNFILKMFKLNDNSNKSRMRLTYYLILQDRIEEAVRIFSKVNYTDLLKQSNLLIQYDYLAAYLDISTGFPEFKVAQEICKNYHNFPILFWRELFEEIDDQIIQYLGLEKISDIELISIDRAKKLSKSETEESLPKLSFKIKDTDLQINHNNITEIKIKYYLIDIEILFSSKPFFKSESQDFSFVKHNQLDVLTIPADKGGLKQINHEIPLKLQNQNLFIEIESNGIKKFASYFCSSIKVQFNSEIGEVVVTESNLKPLRKAYVKCFAKLNNDKICFYKDGYTDLRGRFNYVSLNTNQIMQVKVFSILVIDDVHGSTIEEINPPKLSESTIRKPDQSEFELYQSIKNEQKVNWRMNNKSKK